MSAESSNLINKFNTEAHETVRTLVNQDAESRQGQSSKFTLDG